MGAVYYIQTQPPADAKYPADCLLTLIVQERQMDTPTRITDFGSIDLEVSRVAHGGFGVVYMGPDGLANGAWRALKTLQRGGGQRVYDAFVREALIWR